MKNKFLYLLFVSFVFIASCALALGGDFPAVLQQSLALKKISSFPPLPVLAKGAPFPLISAQAALAIDLDSGVTLYEKDPEKKLLPASTTKIITALVAMDYYSDDTILAVKNIKIDGQKMGLKDKERIGVKELLYGLLIYSGNDAAEVLAQNYPGGREAFVFAMNQKAGQLHLDASHFTNPAGLDSDGDDIVSTARDLTRVAQVAMRSPRFAEIVKTKSITVKSFDGKIAHRLTNINELIGKVDGVLGVKTGWTENARENLVTYIKRGDHKVMLTVLSSQDRFGETEELIDWIFTNYSWQEVKTP